jgi:hypothetical protein
MAYRFPSTSVRVARLVVTIAAMWPAVASAQYKGLHIPGNVGLHAGSQAPPGIYVGNLLWIYPTDTVKDENGHRTGSGDTGLTSSLDGILVSWVTNYRLGGGTVGGSVGLPWVENRIEGNSLSVDTGWGYTDSIVQPINVGWHRKRYDMLTAYTLYLPTGKYEAGGSDNTGFGMVGQELEFAATGFFDEKRLWHGAGSVAHEWHTKKNDTDIRVGQVMTVEGGFGRTFYKKVNNPLPLVTNIGVVAYRQFKVTEDSGSDVPAALAGQKDRVYGLGPELNVFIPQVRLTVIARVIPEFGARVRTQGTTVSITVVYLAKSLARHAP